jgi:hypothetical protein
MLNLKNRTISTGGRFSIYSSQLLPPPRHWRGGGGGISDLNN